MSLDPGVAALVGFVVLGQQLGLRELIAIAMVVVASARGHPQPPLRPGLALDSMAHWRVAKR